MARERSETNYHLQRHHNNDHNNVNDLCSAAHRQTDQPDPSCQTIINIIIIVLSPSGVDRA